MYPHRIRLRGPWQGTVEGDEPRRLTVPCCLTDWGLANAPILLSRRFGYPGRIDAQERVWLTLAEVAGTASIKLNGQFLGEVHDAPFESDVTALLGPRNQVEIQMRGERLGELAMEVRATAFLQGVRIHRAEGKLQVEGTVSGTCDRPLELYVLVDRRNVLYRTIDAGQAFTLALEEEGQTVRVELVHISEVWYVVELPVPLAA